MVVGLAWVEHALAVAEARDCGGPDGCYLEGLPETSAFVAGLLLWGSGCGLIRFAAWLVGDELPRRRRLNAVVRAVRAPEHRVPLERLVGEANPHHPLPSSRLARLSRQRHEQQATTRTRS